MITPRPKAYPAPVCVGGTVGAGSSYSFMLAMIGSGRRVLEFGCASGYMSAHLKAAGNHVTGIEFDAEAAATARDICDEVVVADLDFSPLATVVPGLAYDVLVFGDVLEHLRDPWTVLDEARRFIAPGGFAVISIPNIAHGSIRLNLLQGVFDYSELGILDDTHLRFFTLKSVEELCLRAGYRIEAMERVKVGFFQETQVTPSSREMLFDPELIEQIRRDPEHDTLQFVLRVTPLTDVEKFVALAKELASLRDRLRAAETSARLAQEAYEEAEAELESRGGAGAAEVTRIPAALGKTMSARAIQRAEAFAAANVRAAADLAAAVARHAKLDEAIRELTHANDGLRSRVLELEETLDDRLRQAAEQDERLKHAAEENDRLREALEENESLKHAGDESERLTRSVNALEEERDALKRAQLVAEEENAKFRDAMTLALRRFLRYAEAELERVQARIVEIDSALGAVQGSKLWALKRVLGKLRR